MKFFACPTEKIGCDGPSERRMFEACIIITGPDGTVAMSSANGWVFKAPMGRCKATTPSSLALSSNRVTTNY